MTDTRGKAPEKTPDADAAGARIALVTGASRGIGFAVARRLAREGMHVVATARTVGGLEALDDAIRADGGRCALAPLDLRDGAAVDALGASLFKRFGRLDALVGNAGVLGVLSPVAHVDPAAWEEAFAVNATANFRLIRAMEPLLRQSAAGRAVFVSSRAAAAPGAYWGLYAASKLAMEGLVLSWAAEMARTDVTANIVRPGGIATAMRAQAFPGEDPATLPRPEDMTDRFVALTAPENTRTGEILPLP